MKRRKLHIVILLLLLTAGLGFRIFGAWRYRENLNPDAGVVALMAKHMAEARDFPVFFYGQPYMGSLEPAVSALLCRLFGCSGFMVCLGTALVGFLLLPVTYLWAKDVAGAKAGLAALAFFVISPGVLFHYMGSPRGGYALVLLLGAAVLWLSGRILVRELSGDRVSWGWFFLLGVIAGLGWWTNQLIVAAFVTPAVLFSVLLGRRLWTWRLAGGAAGFFLGSLPFWVWNIRNEWATFNFVHSFGRMPFFKGMYLFFSDRLIRILDLHAMPMLLRLPIGAVFLAVGLVSFGVLARILRKKEKTAEYVHLLMIAVFMIVSLIIFSASHFPAFNTPRYLLPLLPAMAVLVGFSTVRFTRWWPRGLGWLPLGLLVLAQVCVILPGAYARGKRFEPRMRDLHELGDFLREKGVKVVYSPYRRFARNFLLNEEFCFTLFNGGCYPPYAEFAEEALTVAVWGDYGEISRFIAHAGGSSAQAKPGKIFLHYDLKPPAERWQEISPDQWRDVHDSRNEDILGVVADRNLDTRLHHRQADTTDECITLTFREPEELSGFSIVNSAAGCLYPAYLAVEGKRPEQDSWTTILSPRFLSSCYWSGPRFYWHGIHHRLEFRFAPETVSALRIRLPYNEDRPRWGVSELQVFRPAEPLESELEALPGLVDLLEERGIEHLYSDRWVANAVRAGTGGAILTEREPYLEKRTSRNPANMLRFEPAVAIVVKQENADLCRAVLARRRVVMRETSVDPWVLFDFGHRRWQDEYRDDLGLYWAGFTCFLFNDKHWAATMMKRAERLQAQQPDTQEVEALLRESLAVYPGYEHGVRLLADVLRAQGRGEEAENLISSSEKQYTPDIPAGIRFRNGVEFLGISLDSQEAFPGGQFSIRYFWRCPPEVRNEDLACFVHIRNGEVLFQDDHVFLADMEVDYQPYPEVFVEERKVLIPADAQAGTWNIRLGLYYREPNGERLEPNTLLPVDSDAVKLPVNVRIY